MNFNKKTFVETLLWLGILTIVFLIISIRLIRAIVIALILVAIAILGIVWTFAILGNDDYWVIKRIWKFIFRLIIIISYICGLIMFIPILFSRK